MAVELLVVDQLAYLEMILGASTAPAQRYGSPALTVAGGRLADWGADVPVCSPGPAAADPVWPLEQALLALSSSKS